MSQIKNNYKKYAEAVIKAICDYKGIKYTVNNDDYYIVKKGDTLWDIANKYNTSVSNLKNINNLKSNILQIGQKLKIPGNYYIVKSGDSLWKIAKNYNTSISNLIKLNNLKNSTIYVGQKLLIK